MKIASEKEKQKALVTQLQFQKGVLQAVAPTKEHFQQGKSVSGKRIIFSVAQLTKHLTEVLELSQFQEAEPENEGGLTYRSSDEHVKSLSEEKAGEEAERCTSKSYDKQEQSNASPISRQPITSCRKTSHAQLH